MDLVQLEQRMKEQTLIDATGHQLGSKLKDENRDSGTESDEDIPELKRESPALRKDHEKENSRPDAATYTFQVPSVITGLKRVFRPSNRSFFRPVKAGSNSDLNAADRFLPYCDSSCTIENSSSHLPSSYPCDYEDRPSSEEELTSINFGAGKRTWDQANCCDCSDEEVQELLAKRSSTPVMFSASPPRGLPKLPKTLSPHLFLAQVDQNSPHPNGGTELPRKRHRQQVAVETPYSSTVIAQRPCLDFEKMQIYCC